MRNLTPIAENLTTYTFGGNQGVMQITIQKRFDGFINLSQLMALNPNQRSKKSLNTYFNSRRGKKFISALKENKGVRNIQIYTYDSGIYWGCKELAVDIASWIDPVLGINAMNRL